MILFIFYACQGVIKTMSKFLKYSLYKTHILKFLILHKYRQYIISHYNAMLWCLLECFTLIKSLVNVYYGRSQKIDTLNSNDHMNK